jgi:uncharacterized membrane-anchored protein YjiN (DUF445 family)
MRAVETALNLMKAQTLGETGERIDMVNEIILRQRRIKSRSKKILERITPSLKKISRRKKLLLTARLNEKIAHSDQMIKKCEKFRDELLHNMIIQRESIGLFEHSKVFEIYQI